MGGFPEMFRVRQSLERPQVADLEAEIEREMQRIGLNKSVAPGQSVAITAGSRGIMNIPVILRAVVRHFQSLGALPFIVPAMGSHGGGTAAGQIKVLASLGMTPKYCGCEIRASMETVVVCQAKEGFPVHFDKNASGADHVFVVNRVKPHTGFAGDVESGLMKMMLIGLGKHEGAIVYHRVIVNHSFGQIVRSVASEVLSKCRVVGGLAIVENAYDETAMVKAVSPSEFEEREKELLVLAKRWLPRLPFDRADVLVIDEMGKNISGAGFDTNVVGRKFNDHVAWEDEFPKITRIAVRRLTPQSEGNASGIGIAEFCRSQLLRDMDKHYTRTNCLTAGHVTAAMLPLDYETDREMLGAALGAIGYVAPENARMMWIRNTLDIAEVECSAAYLGEARLRRDLEVVAPPRALAFDESGNLVEQFVRALHA
jgi:hypothetical protein